MNRSDRETCQSDLNEDIDAFEVKSEKLSWMISVCLREVLGVSKYYC